MPSRSDPHPLDQAVTLALDALRAAGAPVPRALFVLATGVDPLADRMLDQGRIPTASIPGFREVLHGDILIHGTLGGTPIWLLEDRSGDPGVTAPAGPTAHWDRPFPIWLSKAMGASSMVLATAGHGLLETSPGDFLLASDHLNLSGTSSLIGLGGSHLGPLFPDLSTLHDSDLRTALGQRAAGLGIATWEGVLACTPGPALLTGAERESMRRSGAHAVAHGTAAPLLAAAHAGLGTLALVAITSSGDGATDMQSVLETTRTRMPGLLDLLELAGEALAHG